MPIEPKKTTKDMTLKKAIRKIRHFFFRVQDAWAVLTCKRCALCSSEVEDATRELLLVETIDSAATWLLACDYISKARYDMITTALCDPSVITLSKNYDGTCSIAYDCQTDDDFNDLKDLKIE